MTINEMFNMAKGQTLTQDGCEADVDDKRYNIGDISQKTGLQKTANGWVKPKGEKAPKMGSKEYNKQYGLSKKDVSAGAQVDKIYERQLKRIKELRAKGFTDEQIDNDKIIKQTKEDMKNVGKKSESKPVNDPKLAKEIENGDHFERQKKEAAQKKRDEKLRQERREGEARADDFRKKVESGEIIYNKETGKFEDGKKATESKPAPQEVKLGGGADTYYFEDPDNMSNEDKVFKSLDIELDASFGDHDGDPDNVEQWVENWEWNIKEQGGIGIKSKKTRKEAAPVPADEALEILRSNPQRLKNLIKRAKKFYSGGTMAGGFDDWGEKALGEDCAPRVLTKDTKIRVRKA